LWCAVASRVAPRPSQICRPNAEMGLVAVGRFFENPIQNNFSEIDSRHRNPHPRKSRMNDVGGYMRERVWSRETGEGRTTSISAAGALREVGRRCIQRLRPLSAARRRGRSPFWGARRGASCSGLNAAAARPTVAASCSGLNAAAARVPQPTVFRTRLPPRWPVPSLIFGEGRDALSVEGAPVATLWVAPVGSRQPAASWPTLLNPPGRSWGCSPAAVRCPPGPAPAKVAGRRVVPYVNRPSSRGPLCSLVGDTPRSRRIMAAANRPGAAHATALALNQDALSGRATGAAAQVGL
jgi:hypothetical protein